ncbi:DeoR family transcriptional regulator [Carbonactinospora thermoautotrophica]|uniref:DeoR family transcriptional regulator n=2 Tax=Carbonactinospora thermoautotrophica TaxID=1469144 RepID=A0A132N298_9ACTN|nr:diacylglycerol kinase family protein [Carbonactinospora thermoautotrophica]KWX04157.1 DeoR family transcriptional regulator [Carbonactinospora thermoautotrophica]
MRALLVANPSATTTDERRRDVLVRALASELEIEAVTTEYRGHAIELAYKARAEGVELVIALGGDGTVNEVVNGLLADGPDPGGPALAVVPGGGTNVFARTLGLANDPFEAVGQLLAALRERRRRVIGLGRADDRYFTFCAGLGIDAELMRRVEQRRAEGHRPSAWLYVREGLRQFFFATDRRHPSITLERPGRPPVQGLFLTVVANTAPATYLGPRPISPCPDASYDTGLDVFGMTSLRIMPVAWHAAHLLLDRRRPPQGRSVVLLHDEPEFTVSSERPIALQVDGEALGEFTRVRFVSVPRSLSVIV